MIRLWRRRQTRLETELADLKPQRSAIPFFSTVTGERCAGESCDAVYWARGIRQPVLFAAAVDELADFGVDLWLEVNAHPALAHATQECLAAKERKPPSFRRSAANAKSNRCSSRPWICTALASPLFFGNDAFATSAFAAGLRVGKDAVVERGERRARRPPCTRRAWSVRYSTAERDADLDR